MLPIVSDVLSSIPVQQIRNGQPLSPTSALKRLPRPLVSVFLMKLSLEIGAVAQSAIILYAAWLLSQFDFIVLDVILFFIAVTLIGIIDTQHRLSWSMAANVVVFEGLEKERAKKRCKQLAEFLFNDRGIRTLISIPALLWGLLLALMTVSLTVFPTNLFFWLAVFAGVWVLIPRSAFVNTLFYLELTNPPSASNGSQEQNPPILFSSS